MNKTIFVSIASYRDIDITNTLVDLFNNAEQPKNVFVGLFIQDTSDERSRIWNWLQNKTFLHNVRMLAVPYEEAKGCGWARNVILDKLYNNEDYFFCVDSHSRFLIGWDTEYIKLLENLPSKGVISVYPQLFEFDEEYEEYTKRDTATIYFPNAPVWTNEFIGPHCMRVAIGEYDKVMHLSGGNLFGPGEIANILKVDEYYIPNQEQEIYSLLLFKSGYDIFAIRKNIVWHKYIGYEKGAPYREVCSWSHFKPKSNWLEELENYGGTEHTISEWLENVYKECEECKK